MGERVAPLRRCCPTGQEFSVYSQRAGSAHRRSSAAQQEDQTRWVDPQVLRPSRSPSVCSEPPRLSRARRNLQKSPPLLPIWTGTCAIGYWKPATFLKEVPSRGLSG